MTSSIRKAQLQFDYAALESATRRFVLERTERIHNLARMTATGIVQIGQYLEEVKEQLKHGEFLKWIGSEFGWKERSARSFMMVYAQSKTANFADLQIDVSALYLIAAPSTPEPVRAETIRRAKNGEPITHAGARALVERFRETGEIPEIEVTLPEMIAERRRALELPPPARATPEEASLRRQMKENSARNAVFMGIVEAVERIAQTDLATGEIARFIERFDTPDVDWEGAVGKALVRLDELARELRP